MRLNKTLKRLSRKTGQLSGTISAPPQAQDEYRLPRRHPRRSAGQRIIPSVPETHAARLPTDRSQGALDPQAAVLSARNDLTADESAEEDFGRVPNRGLSSQVKRDRRPQV